MRRQIVVKAPSNDPSTSQDGRQIFPAFVQKSCEPLVVRFVPKSEGVYFGGLKITRLSRCQGGSREYVELQSFRLW